MDVNKSSDSTYISSSPPPYRTLSASSLKEQIHVTGDSYISHCRDMEQQPLLEPEAQPPALAQHPAQPPTTQQINSWVVAMLPAIVGLVYQSLAYYDYITLCGDPTGLWFSNYSWAVLVWLVLGGVENHVQGHPVLDFIRPLLLFCIMGSANAYFQHQCYNTGSIKKRSVCDRS